MADTYLKDPDAVLDYVVDWSSWLATGETITAHTVTADSGITLGAHTNTTTTVTAWLSGGTTGTNYNIVCHITTSGGRQEDRTFTILCRQR